ncbi:MAG: hypothetical protein WA374_11745, partial [Acidobacteriaceae bacterium]
MASASLLSFVSHYNRGVLTGILAETDPEAPKFVPFSRSGVEQIPSGSRTDESVFSTFVMNQTNTLAAVLHRGVERLG